MCAKLKKLSSVTRQPRPIAENKATSTYPTLACCQPSLCSAEGERARARQNRVLMEERGHVGGSEPRRSVIKLKFSKTSHEYTPFDIRQPSRFLWILHLGLIPVRSSRFGACATRGKGDRGRILVGDCGQVAAREKKPIRFRSLQEQEKNRAVTARRQNFLEISTFQFSRM